MKNKCSKELSHSSEDEEESDKSVIDVDNSSKFIPIFKLPEKLKTKKIIINISDTHYPIVEQVAQQFGWIIQKTEGIGDWDIWWTDRQLAHDTLYRMNLHQKINHFPGIQTLARKNLLGMNLMAMKQHFPTQYNFFPETWIIPLQFRQFRNYFQENQKKERTYIVKPEALSQGKGIFLTRKIEDIINGRKYVIQRYILNPFLIQELKFDLRIYVLMSGTDPLRLYIYKEGLTRFATKKYEQPNQQNMGQNYIHLTNYSLNKSNPDYIFNSCSQEQEVGHKRSLTSTYKFLSKLGYDVVKLQNEINDLIIKTIIAGLPPISHQYQYCQPDEFQNNMCFHILGFDVFIDSELKPYLIEVNHTPSFETASPLDYDVKKHLIKDSLRLMRITSQNKKKQFQRGKQLIKRRVQSGKRVIIKGKQRQKLLREAQIQRDIAQEKIVTGYTKIYPVDDDKKLQLYEKMIESSEKIHSQTEETRKKMIRDEQQKIKKKSKKIQQNQFELASLNRSANITADLAKRRKKLLNTQNVTLIKNEEIRQYDTTRDKQALKIKEMKFKFASHMYYSGRVTDGGGGGEEHEDHLFEVRKSITRNRKTSLVTGKQKKTGAFLTPKTYEIAGSQRKDKKFLSNQKSWQPGQVLLSNIKNNFKNYKIETSGGKRDIRVVEKGKGQEKIKKFSFMGF